MKETIDFICVIYKHDVNIINDLINNINDKLQYCNDFDYKINLIFNHTQNYFNDNYKNLLITNTITNIIITNSNLGYCKGNNYGIENSNNSFKIIINPDIEILDSLCIKWLISTSKIYNCISGKLIGDNWITYPSCFPVDKYYDNIDELKFYFNNIPDFKIYKPFKYIDGCLFCFHKDLYYNHNIKFDENIFPGYFSEVDLCFTAYLNNIQIKNANIDKLFKHNSLSLITDYNNVYEWSLSGRNYFYKKIKQNYNKFNKYLNQ